MLEVEEDRSRLSSCRQEAGWVRVRCTLDTGLMITTQD